MIIRNASIEDLDRITEVEALCFPPLEAASRESFYSRLRYFPEHFWLLEIERELVSFIDGSVTDENVISDEMFEKAEMHNKDGAWQTIMGVNTIPSHRKKGYADLVMRKVIEDAKAQGRKGCILTCKEQFIHYYEKFGYVNEGLSNSQHGGAVWYDMRLTF